MDELVGAARALFESVPVGGTVIGRPELARLAMGIEGVIRSHAAHQYAGWPDRSTTDGLGIDFGYRVADRTIQVIGLAWLDFAGDIFPWRANLIAEMADDGIIVAIEIGNVAAGSGEPPRYKRGTILLQNENDVVEVVVGRHQLPIAWTPAISVRIS